MTRQRRKKKGIPQKGGSGSFPIINHNAAGIDMGSEEHWVAVPDDRDENPVRPFGCFTSDLHAMARWLKACGVTTVSMESTGVYWIPAFQILKGLKGRRTCSFDYQGLGRSLRLCIPRSGPELLLCCYTESLVAFLPFTLCFMKPDGDAFTPEKKGS